MFRRFFAVLALSLLLPLTASAQENFGVSSTFVGSDLLVGQPANFYGPGVVYVFSGEAGAWRERERLRAPDAERGDGFGRALATVGDVLLVGAPGASTVYPFLRNGASWSVSSGVVDPTGAADSGFGAAVVVSGEDGFVGAPSAEGTGLVYRVRVVDGEVEVVEPLTSSAEADSGFGTSLGLDGERLLVGAPGAAGGMGAAFVFRRTDSGDWVEEAVLTSDAERGRLGTSVQWMDGRAAVGAPGAPGGGMVRLYTSSGEGWEPAGTLTIDEAAPNTRFGTALATVDAELWVGAPGGGGGDGQVRRFAPTGDAMSSAGVIAADSANTGAWPFGFGRSIAPGDGVVAVGMPTRDFGEGRAALFTPTASGEWDQSATFMGEIVTAVEAIAEGSNCDEGMVEVFECKNIEVISFTPVSELGGARGVWVNDVWGWTDPQTGRDYALVARRDGAAFVDLTDPASPRFAGELLRTPGSRPSVWRDIKVYGNHAYIVSDGAGAHGMQVFDLTRLRSVGDEPVTFEMDVHYDRVHSAHNVVVDTDSGFLYIVGANGGGETCGGGLHMVDVRSPKEPTFLGCYNDATGAGSQGYTHDAQCLVYEGPDTRYTGREICVGSNAVELNIADVTDKDSPTPVGRASYPGVAYAHQGWFDETQRYFYMGDELDEVAGNVDGTRTLIWDLSELDDPILVNEYIAPVQATDHNMFVRGNRVYQSNYGSGLRVLDISDPVNPYEYAFFDSAPMGNDEAGMSSAQSGAWSNYPFFESGLVVFTSVREGLFVVRVKPPLIN